MNTIDFLNLTTKYAKEYKNGAQDSINRNKHMNEVKGKIEQSHIEAVLVDFINYIAAKNSVDYCLYTSDFSTSEEAKELQHT